MTHYIHNINPIILDLPGELAIRWYGLSYLLGFLASILILRRWSKRGEFEVAVDEVSNFVVMLAFFGVFLGGRLGYVLFYSPDLLLDFSPIVIMGFDVPLWGVLKVWDGGMASHGGFLGVLLAAWWIARRNAMKLGELSDILVTLVPPGILFGRLANFINGELWGKASTVPWAVIFPASAAPGTPAAMIAPRHPSQLYEAGLEGLFLLLYTQWRFWKSDVTRRPGQLTAEFLMLYALVRVLGELFREPDADLILGMSRGIFYSLFLLLAGGLLFWRARKSPS